MVLFWFFFLLFFNQMVVDATRLALWWNSKQQKRRRLHSSFWRQKLGVSRHPFRLAFRLPFWRFNRFTTSHLCLENDCCELKNGDDSRNVAFEVISLIRQDVRRVLNTSHHHQSYFHHIFHQSVHIFRMSERSLVTFPSGNT